MKRFAIKILKNTVIKKVVYFLLFIIPILLLKFTSGMSYQKSKTVFYYYLSAALYRKKYMNAIRVFWLFLKISWKEFSPDYQLFNKKQYKTKKEVWYIGKWYSIKPEILETIKPKNNTANTKLFSIGREAIAQILKCNKFDRKVAILPNFTCFTVLDPFLQYGWEIHFYSYNKNLTINNESFTDVFKRVQPSICIFQALSGMGFTDNEKSLIDYVHENKCITVIDQTQDIYNDKNNPAVDFYCGSLRKWYPFPDGAFLYSPKNIIEECDDIEENSIYRTSMGLCMFASHLNSIYQNSFFEYLYKFMWTFSVSYIGNTEIISHTMSDYSRKVLAMQDEKFNSQTRINNFNYIYQGINNLKKVRPAFENIQRLNSVPLSFPIYVENRSKFAQFLIKNGISSQILWSRPPYIRKNIELDETTKYIYDHILSLPCDQRYSLEDMKRMVDIISEYDQMK